jgi:CDP-diacylglycerol--glycerol-3-phosphate 3-phosphatidyltransferase
VGRARNEVTEMGAVLDIALDRSVGNILWITFMYLGKAPLWVLIVFLIRSFIVDGIRGVALARGKSGFGMMHSPWGRFLVASRFMRSFYGSTKAVVFCQLYLTSALALKIPNVVLTLHPLNQSLIFLVAGLCVIRGIPVLLDGRIYFKANKV